MVQHGSRRALITGFTGQDGSFLAELLLEKGYEIAGMIRGDPDAQLGASEHLRGLIELVRGDLLEPERLRSLVAELQPDELYHLAGPSFVPDSWEHPSATFAAIAGSTAMLLEAVRAHSRHTRVFVALSGAIFGQAPESAQREDTHCHLQNP